MKVLWAPWRMEYILNNNKEEGCIFCPGEKENQPNDPSFSWENIPWS